MRVCGSARDLTHATRARPRSRASAMEHVNILLPRARTPSFRARAMQNAARTRAMARGPKRAYLDPESNGVPAPCATTRPWTHRRSGSGCWGLISAPSTPRARRARRLSRRRRRESRWCARETRETRAASRSPWSWRTTRKRTWRTCSTCESGCGERRAMRRACAWYRSRVCGALCGVVERRARGRRRGRWAVIRRRMSERVGLTRTLNLFRSMCDASGFCLSR